jgi:hypothetical protein
VKLFKQYLYQKQTDKKYKIKIKQCNRKFVRCKNSKNIKKKIELFFQIKKITKVRKLNISIRGQVVENVTVSVLLGQISRRLRVVVQYIELDLVLHEPLYYGQVAPHGSQVKSREAFRVSA